jgi:hypothetical protein
MMQQSALAGFDQYILGNCSAPISVQCSTCAIINRATRSRRYRAKRIKLFFSESRCGTLAVSFASHSGFRHGI